jgi:pyrroloquinoline-quinone synthase
VTAEHRLACRIGREALEARLRAVGAERYHDKHPFHRLLHGGSLSRGQVQAWALNRYYYQSRIPAKDAILLSRLETPELRREWRRRLADHDGREGEPGGLERWLRLATGLGLDRDYVVSTEGILPGVRYAVDAYVAFVRDRSVLEAIASSLTELFAPAIIRDRMAGMLRHYDFIDMEILGYFRERPSRAAADSRFALDHVLRHAASEEDQERAVAALRYKCDLLWAQLDALHHAYVEPALTPPGAFRP